MRLGIGLWLRSLLSRASSGSTLLNGLVSYWPLDETSGVRYDAVGSNHLTDNNTVGSVLRGPEGTVASFVAANSESLSVADNPTLAFGEAGEGCTLAVWTRLTGASSGYGQILGRGWSGGRPIEVVTETGATTPLYFRIEAGGSVQTSTAYPQDSGWHLVLLWFDPSDKKARLSIDNGTPVVSTAAANAALDPTTAPFEIGGGTGGVGSITGNLGEAAIWSRVLTSDERTALFASGNGLRYADLSAGLKTGLVSWWELDEVSGVRYDSHGSNDLTDNNTVGSATSVTGAMDGAAASFVAANSESLTKASLGFDWTAAWALSLWAKFADSSAYYDFINVTGGPIRVYRAIATGNVTPSFNSAATNPASTYVADNEWVMLTFWHDGSGEYGYSVNNAAPITASGTQCGAGTNLFFGIYSDGGSNPLSGWMDEVAIWDRVLTADERAELYALGAGKFYPFS